MRRIVVRPCGTGLSATYRAQPALVRTQGLGMWDAPMIRRHWLTRMFFGAGLLGLRSMASGIPVSVLQNPRAFASGLTDAVAERSLAAANRAQFLVLSTSDAGEPMNCNVPGMYAGQGFLHPTAPSMAQTNFALGGQMVTAAAAWSTLSASSLQRACFFHAATSYFAHGDLFNVHQLGGRVADNEYLVSAMAKALAEPLGAIQPQPISIIDSGGAELIKYNGAQQPAFSPLFMKSLLTTPAALSALDSTQALRDQDLDTLHNLLGPKATPPQKALLDSWATSQVQARSLPQALVAQLAGLKDNSITSQMTAALIMCQMKLSPAVLVRLPFGGDNHVDNDGHQGPGQLPAEAAQHAASVAAINGFTAAASSAGQADAITFATLTTFGRSNAPADLSGRAHNGQHTCNLIVGANVKPSVVGGATLVGSNPVAMAIDSQSGLGSGGGDIAYGDTLAAYGSTLGLACGLSADTMKKMVNTGTPVAAALAQI